MKLPKINNYFGQRTRKQLSDRILIENYRHYFKKYHIVTLPTLYIFEILMFVKTNPNLFDCLVEIIPPNRRNNG